MRAWQIQEAKNKLSEVVDRAMAEGPQTITRRGRNAAVVLSASDFKKLKTGRTGLAEFFRRSPLVGEDLDFGRSRDAGRAVKL
ncbi:MAG: prevent-host-death protein [Candidatus Lindowbacteria bacterium RIFCSPLOWO2_12_FULL_62_27]|nr:MAG: prevent-host-death protein [Candidatus Lindowbacteria bacterium RIFCSPLOWO2_02_FULL_62_12]OGH60849.1 MAG: prevent-host-death protein [Candidatus Lindowbacteria bacterium RIFCSPLOWO2_12_FULL_62_27]